MQSDDRAALKYSSGTGGARGCLSPRAGGTGLVSGGGERLVLCPFPRVTVFVGARVSIANGTFP